MKKIILVLATLIVAFALLSACSENKPASTTTSVVTTVKTGSTTTVKTTSDGLPVETTGGNVTTSPTVPDAPTVVTRESTLEELDGYSGMTNPIVFVPQNNQGEEISFSGSGEDLIADMDVHYSRYDIYYYLYDGAEYTRVGKNKVKTLDAVTATYEIVRTADQRTANAYIKEASVTLVPDYISYTAQSGTFVTITFKTNIAANFKVSIGAKGSVEGAINHENILPLGENGNYTGIAQMTVPYISEGKHYVNFSIGDKVIDSTEINITPASETSEYKLLMTGAWHLIENDQYRENLVDLFYSVYPRLYARWGNGTEPKTITFVADRTYDGVAYCAGTKVVVATDYAHDNPNDLGFFSHEITHSVQQYHSMSSDWWTENMANYGGFRYFHWSSSKHVQVFFANDRTLQDWGYEPYGNNKWFFAYMDARYPTTKDGSMGLIDSINFAIKSGRITSDDPKNASNNFNKVVKEVTGLDTIEDVRLRYVEELKDGTWAFVGFGEYKDNYLTENLEGLENIDYPMYIGPVFSDKTCDTLDSVIKDGENLALGAEVIGATGYTKDAEAPGCAFDGDENTKWCSTRDTVSDNTAALLGMNAYIVIDLGSVKSFNTYTMVLAGIKESAANNAKRWEILVSEDGKNWTAVDYRENNTLSELSVNIGEQRARYVRINLIKADSSAGTVRLHEFMLFNR